MISRTRMTELETREIPPLGDGPRSILLTGGTGFFGRTLLRHWAAEARSASVAGFRVVVVTRNSRAFLSRYLEFGRLPWLKLVDGDVERAETLPWQDDFTHLIHAAADSTAGPRMRPIERYDQIVGGTRNMLEFASRKGVKRFLLASSGAVYGPLRGHPLGVSEDCLSMPDPLLPVNAYGVAKRAAEHLCALYRDLHGVETVIARCFAFAGRDLPLDAHFAIGNFVRDALRCDEIVVRGDGSAIRSYLEQSDLARWLLALLERGAAGRAYNVGSDRAISVGELARLVRDLVAPGKSVRILGERHPHTPIDTYVPDVTRARGELGLEVTVDLPLAIVEMARAAGPGAT